MKKHFILLLICQLVGSCRTVASTKSPSDSRLASGAISGAGDSDPFLEFMCRVKIDGDRVIQLQRNISVTNGSVFFSLDPFSQQDSDSQRGSEHLTPTIEVEEIPHPTLLHANPIVVTSYTGSGGFNLVIRSREEHIEGDKLIEEWPWSFAEGDLNSYPRFRDYLKGAMIYRGVFSYKKYNLRSVPLLCWYYPFVKWVDIEEFARLISGSR